MRFSSTRLIVGLLACLSVKGATTQATILVKELNVRVTMRDGARLSANVFRPEQKAKLPTILIRTPYGKGIDLIAAYQAFVSRGYAVVVQDVRGRYASDGAFRPLSEGPDGYDTIDWISAQPWSDGRIGMIGGSYLGIAQWKAALLNNPHLKAISPVVSGADEYRDRFYSTGGALKLGHRLLWLRENMRAAGSTPPDFDRYVLHLPLRTSDVAATGQKLGVWQQSLDHPTDDAFWRSNSVRKQVDKVTIPVLSFGGWYDNFVESDLEIFAARAEKSPLSRVVIGPWPHNMSIKFNEDDYGPHSSASVRAMQIDWMDHWLKGKDTSILSSAPVRIFVMGKNEWRDEQEWPLARAKPEPFYLTRKAGLSKSHPGSTEEPDRYVYDPHDPVPTHGGAVCCNPKIFPWGPLDQIAIEKRADVLTYTSSTLKKDMEVTGPIKVVLYISTSAPDTDFTAKLVDVFPNGSARILTDGILRLRYRESLEKPVLATPGQMYEVGIDAGVTSNVFLKGHKIRVEISSSNFPRFDRNPNTGRVIADETELRKASQVVYHDRRRASHILLPVVEDVQKKSPAKRRS